MRVDASSHEPTSLVLGLWLLPSCCHVTQDMHLSPSGQGSQAVKVPKGTRLQVSRPGASYCVVQRLVRTKPHCCTTLCFPFQHKHARGALVCRCQLTSGSCTALPILLNMARANLCAPCQVSIAGLHHNPAVWPEVDAYKPERHLPEEAAAAGLGPRCGPNGLAFAPFGGGGRLCVGKAFAMQEVGCGVLLMSVSRTGYGRCASKHSEVAGRFHELHTIGTSRPSVDGCLHYKHGACHNERRNKPSFPHVMPSLWRWSQAKLALIGLFQRYTFELQPGWSLKTFTGITLAPVDGVHVKLVPRAAQ